MWNRPKPAPEYQVAWRNKTIVKQALATILAAHGELIEDNVQEVLRKAWAKVLNA